MPRALPRLGVVALLATTGLLTLGAQTEAPPERAAFTLVATGDSVITRPLSVHREPEFLKLIELVRGADASFSNLEMLFHDYESYPMSESGGTWMRADPALAKDWCGPASTSCPAPTTMQATTAWPRCA